MNLILCNKLVLVTAPNPERLEAVRNYRFQNCMEFDISVQGIDVRDTYIARPDFEAVLLDCSLGYEPVRVSFLAYKHLGERKYMWEKRSAIGYENFNGVYLDFRLMFE